MKPTVLFLFNTSPYASAPWVNDGRFNVVHVDYNDTDHSGAHRKPPEGIIQLSIDLSNPYALEAIQRDLEVRGLPMPSLVVSFPPCTDLAVSGARHFASKLANDPDCQQRAARMAKLASLFGCPYIVENPVSILSTLWRKPDAITNPCDYAGYLDPAAEAHPEFPGLIPDGDRYNKKTCYWAGHGFIMPEKQHKPPLSQDNHGWAKLGGKSARTKYIRSLTPRGWAIAVYEANVNSVLSAQYHNKVVDKAFLKAIIHAHREVAACCHG